MLDSEAASVRRIFVIHHSSFVICFHRFVAPSRLCGF
jgi:hypothetical protein